MADAGYRIAPIFLIRMAGVPFEALENLATSAVAHAGRGLIAAETEFAQAKTEFEDLSPFANAISQLPKCVFGENPFAQV